MGLEYVFHYNIWLHTRRRGREMISMRLRYSSWNVFLCLDNRHESTLASAATKTSVRHHYTATGGMNITLNGLTEAHLWSHIDLIPFGDDNEKKSRYGVDEKTRRSLVFVLAQRLYTSSSSLAWGRYGEDISIQCERGQEVIKITFFVLLTFDFSWRETKECGPQTALIIVITFYFVYNVSLFFVRWWIGMLVCEGKNMFEYLLRGWLCSPENDVWLESFHKYRIESKVQ